MTTHSEFIYKTDGKKEILVEEVYGRDKMKTNELTQEEYDFLSTSAWREKDYKVEKNGFKYYIKTQINSTSRILRSSC